MDDTDPRVRAILVDGYRRMTPSEKLAQVKALTLAVQELALIDIRRRHPNATAREHALRLASRWLAPETMRKAFNWDPDHEGF